MVELVNHNMVCIFGRQDSTGDKWIGVQCKGKDANFDGKVTECFRTSAVKRLSDRFLMVAIKLASVAISVVIES